MAQPLPGFSFIRAGLMRKVQAWFGVAALLLAAIFGGRAIAEVQLPEGPNRDLVAKTCSACHDLDNLTLTGGLTREDWDGTLDDMMSYGARFTPDERKMILEYLVIYLPPKKK
jgi:hypothetical protein